MSFAVTAVGSTIPPASDPIINPVLKPGDFGAGAVQKYWYDYLLRNGTDIVALQSAIEGLLAPKSSFSAHKNGSNQTIATTSATKLTFLTELFDVNDNYTPITARWTPPAGLVLINARATLLSTNAVDQSTVDLTIFKNGSAYAVGDVTPVSGTTTISVGAHVLDGSSGTDFYEVFLTLSTVSGGSRTVFGGQAATYFQGTAL